MKVLTSLISVVLLLCFALPTHSQIPLEVQTSVVPPYPKQFSFWSSNASAFFVTVINNSDSDFDFYVKVAIESSDGQTFARFFDDYRPTRAFTIPANQMRTFDSAVIGNNYDNLSLDQLDISDNIPIDANGELPAGEYQICVQLVEYIDDPSAPLVFLSPETCSEPFEVNQGNIELLYPFDNDVAPAQVTTSFNWFNNNLSALEADQQYVLKIYELDSLTAANEYIYDMVETGSLPTFYASEPTADIFYLYNHDIGLPVMTEGYQYAAQVELVDAGGLYFENRGRSNINAFWYGFDPTVPDSYYPPDTVKQSQIDCFENCNYSLDGNTNLLSNSNPESIEVGHFTMDDLEVTSSAAGYFSGTGRILIPWLNEVYVKTHFSNIKVNVDSRMIEGQVQAAQAPDIPTYAAEFNSFIATGRLIAGLAGSSASLDLPLGINQNIAGYNFLVGITEITWTPTTADANTACNFHVPAFGEQYISLESSETCMHPGGFGNEFYLHMGHDVSIAGNGDITVNLKGSAEVDIDQVEEEACYVQMDCNGMKAISLKADVFFPESMLLKENVEDGSIINDVSIGAENRVKANFNFTLDRETNIDENVYALYGEEGIPYENGLHFITKATVEDPFQIKGLQGWGFQANNIWVDASDVKNPSNIEFPEAFVYDGGTDGAVDDTWTGFYMKRLTMRTPKEFLRDGGREEIFISDAILDPTITLTVGVGEVVGINEGEVDKWSFSIDEIFMDIVQGRFEAGGMHGQVGLPITSEGTFIDYSAIISDSDLTNSQIDSLEYVFTMSPAEVFEVPLLVAQVELDPASYIAGGIKPGSDASTYFELYAAGGLAFNSDLFSSADGSSMLPLNSPLASFDLKFHSKNGFTQHNFSFLGDFQFESTGHGIAGPSENTGSGTGSYGSEYNRESFAGFPLTMTDMSIENTDLATGEFNFKIVPEITLTPGVSGVAAAAVLNIPSKLNYTAEDGNRLQLQGLYPSGINIDSEIGGCKIGGYMEFYNDQGSSGVGSKGVKGGLDVMLPMGIGIMMDAEFGTMVEDPQAEYNTENNYPYFYVDGMAYFGETGGVPLAGALALYGVGGGLSYNMTRSSYEGDEQAVADQLAAVNSGKPVSPESMKSKDIRPTGIYPTPSFGVYGLKIAGTIGTAINAGLLNADISVEGEFELNRGLTLLAVRGNGFMLTPLADRSDPSVEAMLNIVYETPAPGLHEFSGDLTVWANFNDMFYGSGENNKVGTAAIHADNGSGNNDGSWHFHLGKPKDRMGFALKLAGMAEAEANTYFMLGHGLPTKLPVPSRIQDLFGETNSGKGGGLDSETIHGAENREEDDIQDAADGTGFALGAEAEVFLNLDALGVYAYLGVYLGFDINVTHSLTRTCYIPGQGSMSPGTNGWYGAGQIYAGLEGGMGFRIKAFGKNHDLELFALKAAMMLSGGGPNPFWAEGRAGISIRVLNGLIKCNKNISIRVGQQCTPAYTDPFGGVPLIAEHWPEHDAKKQSTYTKPKVSFTFPMNEVVTLPMLNDKGETYNNYLEPKFENLEFKEKKTDEEVEFSEVWSDENRQLKLKPIGNLSPFTKYEVSMRLYAIDYPNLISSLSKIGGTRVKVNGTNWYQDTTFVFKTGDLTSLDTDLTTSTPIRDQRYFTQEDVYQDEASMSFDVGANQADYFPVSEGVESYEYFIRFSPMDGGETVEADLHPFESDPIFKITYDLPELDNSQTYAAQLIQKVRFDELYQSVSARLGPLNFSLANSSESSVADSISSETTVEFKNQKINPAEDLGWNESAMLTYFFRTSMFDTYEEKFAGASTSMDFGNGKTDLLLDMDELLDEFDVKGETWNGIKTMDPLVQIFDPIDYANTPILFNYTSYYADNIRDIIVDLAESYETRRTWPEGFNLPNTWPADELHFDYLSDPELDLTKKVKNYKGKLTDADIDNSWAATLNHTYNAMNNDVSVTSFEDMRINITLWNKLTEDRLVILDWAAEVYAGKTGLIYYKPWIDVEYKKFNTLVAALENAYFGSNGRTKKYRINLYRDMRWRDNNRGVIFDTIDYEVD